MLQSPDSGTEIRFSAAASTDATLAAQLRGLVGRPARTFLPREEYFERLIRLRNKIG